MAGTLYGFAKKYGFKNPQHLYNLAKNGIIKVSKVECNLGHEHVVVDEESIAAYLERRAEREAKKEAEAQAELEGSDS